MYPLGLSQPYPIQQWWMAAYSSEVTREIFPRTILDMPIVFYRKENGDPVAVSGLCPHRYLPMEKGCLVGDSIQCGYHGFTFEPSGECTKIPSQEDVPENSKIRSFPLHEHGDTIWIWTGDPEKVDMSLLPDFDEIGLGAEGWSNHQTPIFSVKARYPLVLENLMDLSHISFVHSDTIPGGEAVAAVPAKLIERDKSFNLKRLMVAPPNPLLQMFFPDYSESTIGQSIDAEYFGPHLIRTGGKFVNPSTYEDGSNTGVIGTLNYLHLVTPETANSTHYFVNTARNFGLGNTAIEGFERASGPIIGGQDKVVLEEIEAGIQRHGTISKELSCQADVGGFRMRRRLSDQITAEIA